MSTREFFHATKVVSGAGTINQVGSEAAALGAKKVLIITDGFLVQSEAMGKIRKSLDDAGVQYEIYKDVRPNPRDEDCCASAELAKKINAQVIIGFGGGSSMDQCKATAALVTNGGTCKDWDGIPLKENKLPIICIPTTAGTGSEVTFVAVITDPVRKFKMSVFDPEKLVPNVAIADPEITLTLPASLTASTGVDALTHAIEAYTCKVSQPITDAVALHAIELISRNLKIAVEDGKNLAARENMMIGSVMAGIAFINSNVGAVHAISETIGGWYDTPHGVCNSIFLPYVMEYNLPAAEERLAVVAERMGIDPKGKTRKVVALEGIQFVKDLSAATKIPKLNSFDYIKKDNFRAIAETSAKNMLSDDNARDIDADGYIEILKAAYQGK
jgi:Alcohol dehydrogenase, class IV